MKNRIRTYFVDLAPVMAAEMLLFLSDEQQALVWERGMYREECLVETFLRLGDALAASDPLVVRQQIGVFSDFFEELGLSNRHVAEQLRNGRDKIIEHLLENASCLLITTEDQLSFYQIQLQLYQAVDNQVAKLLELGQVHSDIGMGMQVPSRVNNKNGAPFAEVAEQELVQIVLQSLDIAVLMIDHQMNIVEANQALAKLFQVDREKILGQNIDEIFRPHEGERFVQWVLERGQTGHYVAEYWGQWTTVSTSPIYHDGELWGAIAVLRNLTDSNRYEEELTKREALAAVGQLAAGMAHEIRNPLTSIKGFIQLLREQEETNRRETYFSVILTEIERIDGLLNDVLVLARYRDDKIVSECFPVMEELSGVIRLLEPEANRRGIKLELQIANGAWYIYGYRSRIKQAFLNILKNAFEALTNGGSLVRITVITSIHRVVITVEDDGPGMSDETLQNLFIPFFTTKQEGTGLGLSTTQRIITDHGGEIFAGNSSDLKGARFEIRLPLRSKEEL
ncbi:ATP-binding protein [Brevibacillus nitrificans]|uniref:two-component system sensor histidine kinase NtrB n=1 Tax=Brevibacillus TaxID=55080 RepID=UPI00285FD37C|nr:ATP-binding protein [Brevibacillus nitrificans]MDR7316278.1 PAS domain S-box-containing protein [Brevibacillus nitrificans]